jgi:hypothetical protein
MIYAQLLGFGLGVFFLVSYVPCVTDLEGAIGDETGYPFLFVFKNAFSPAFVHATTVTVALLILAGTLPYNLSSSMQILAVCSFANANRGFSLTSSSLLVMEAFPFQNGSLESIPYGECPRTLSF